MGPVFESQRNHKKNGAYIVQFKKNCASDFMIAIGKANADEGLLSVTSASF